MRTSIGSSVRYDVIVVGARVAGASTAMLLARRGYRVLLVDRRRPGSDTVSTHALMRGGVLQLKRWGLLDRVIESGTPAISRTVVHYGDAPEVIDLKSRAGVGELYAPRRTVLDSILAPAAEEAGVDVRFGTTVCGLLTDASGRVRGITVATRGAKRSAVARPSPSAPTGATRRWPAKWRPRSPFRGRGPAGSSTATARGSRATGSSGSTGRASRPESSPPTEGRPASGSALPRTGS